MEREGELFFFFQIKAAAWWNIVYQLKKELQYIPLKQGMSQLHLRGVGVTFQSPLTASLSNWASSLLLVLAGSSSPSGERTAPLENRHLWAGNGPNWIKLK